MREHDKKSVITLTLVVIVIIALGYLLGHVQPTLTGAVVSTGDTVACHVNSDCNDRFDCTADSCKNPGELISFCHNTPITSCLSGDGCCPVGCKRSNDNDC